MLGEPEGTITSPNMSPFVTEAPAVKVTSTHVFAVIDPAATEPFVFVPNSVPLGFPVVPSIDSSLTSVVVGVVDASTRKQTLSIVPVLGAWNTKADFSPVASFSIAAKAVTPTCLGVTIPSALTSDMVKSPQLV